MQGIIFGTGRKRPVIKIGRYIFLYKTVYILTSPAKYSYSFYCGFFFHIALHKPVKRDIKNN